ncbi:uncharacterized protein L201_004259 [Kwoniella dendrophila CBS 6074]|uniref:Uncharacterized protein n=1 Tax=Kwoniella dendrophila CBS 6074 TaxID=1295534 RepID=A0AAX4JXT0_9TREE
MSVSSATTLISPTSTKAATPSAAAAASGSHHHAPQRKNSVHSSHGMKRRPSSHSAHGHHGHSSSNRRSSEGEHGRRALAAGLAMHALDTTDAVLKKKKEKPRPSVKSSRSDTHLPRLSRTASIASETSHESQTSHGHQTTHGGRPRRGSHKKSEESVQIIKPNGEEGEEVEENEEGWESGGEVQGEGEDEDEQLEISPEKSKKGKSRFNTKNQNTNTDSGKMRRAVSNTSVEPTNQLKRQQSGVDPISGVLGPDPGQPQPQPQVVAGGGLQESPEGYSQSHTIPPQLTQRTTGFAGTIQPPDPQVAAQLPTQDPHPIVTPHPIRRNTSAKSLIGPIHMEPTTSNDSAPSGPHKRQPSLDRVGSRNRSTSSTRPEISSRLRSTEGSGLPQTEEKQDISKSNVSTSPSYPFPQMHNANEAESQQQAQTSQTRHEKRSEQEESRQSQSQQHQRKPSRSEPQTRSQSQIQPPSQAQNSAARTRQASQPHPQLQHRYSNSSLRSIQSLRAPPHPLNSPTGYRTHATTATSRPGSMFGSPTKDDNKRQRVPSMHQPPVPQPQISYELAKGQGWDEGAIPEEDVPRRSINQSSSSSSTTKSKNNQNNRPQQSRKDSISSMKSIFAPLTTPILSSPARSSSGQGSSSRRKTAIEAASEASKMSSTNDPTLYHNSLGHQNIPETVYLISRFLPSTKNRKGPSSRRPKWEMDMRDPSIIHQEEDEDDDDENENINHNNGMKIGLTNGDYRESHESLIKTIKNLGKEENLINQRRANMILNRSYSSTYNNLLLSHSTSGNITPVLHGSSSENDGLGLIKTTKDGTGLTVKKGSFAGKTPFEMSVQRCLAQRPGGLNGIGF